METKFPGFDDKLRDLRDFMLSRMYWPLKDHKKVWQGVTWGIKKGIKKVAGEGALMEWNAICHKRQITREEAKGAKNNVE